jgi:cytochrome c oxidase cbb3-type subunit 1
MWNGGILQGLMWRTYNENGTLAYSFIDSMQAMHPYYIVRMIGGLLFLLGGRAVGFLQRVMTIRRPRDVAADEQPPVAYGLQPAE